MAGIRRYHLARRAVGPGYLAIMWALMAPGAVTAGTSIALPDYAKPAKKLIDALLLKTAAGALVTEAKKLTVVETTPAAGQIRLVDDDKVVLGEDTAADDVLIVIVELKP